MLFLLSVNSIVRAQAVVGTVKDVDGHPLNSVAIFLKGTNYTTETDDEGKFKLNAPAGKPIHRFPLQTEVKK